MQILRKWDFECISETFVRKDTSKFKQRGVFKFHGSFPVHRFLS